MNNILVKQEFEVDVLAQCRVCLSVGRRLFPLTQYMKIFKILTSEFINSANMSLDFVQICWECIATLKKVLRFQIRVRKANELLQLGQGYIDNKLSTLTTHILNNTNTKYIDATNAQTDIEIKVIKTLENDESDHSDIIGETFAISDTESAKTVVRHTADVKKEYNNRWAKKRALEKKIPKFKTLPIIIDRDVFRRVQIDINEVYRCQEKERDSEWFKSKRYRCEKCVIGFSRDYLLLRHKRKYHNNLAEYTCDICKAKFTYKRILSRHLINHYFNYECSLCGISCRNEAEKKAHLRKHRTALQCLKCGLKFCNRRDFFKHHKERHEKYICDHCGVSFKMRYCIKDHIRKQHSPFQCKPCDRTFGRYNGLWLHNKLRHSPRGQPAYCVECDKHYIDVYRYRWHLANSAKHKPRKRVRVACPDCDKVFTKNIYMKEHYNLVHLKKFNYRCEECNKNFIRNADLVRHRRRVHEGILPPKNKMCYVCDKGFTTNEILTNHMRTHTGERPYECSACPARFAQRTALVSHLNAVHRKLRELQ